MSKVKQVLQALPLFGKKNILVIKNYMIIAFVNGFSCSESEHPTGL
jgi:hypothetical protein